MHPSLFARDLGVIAIFLCWATGFLIVHRWRGERTMSMSLHAAANKHAYMIFALILSLAAIASYLFFTQWFAITFHLPPVFNFIVTVAIVLQAVTAFVPDAPGVKSRIHRLCAYGEAFLLPVILIFSLVAARAAVAAKVMTVLMLAWMVFSCLLFIFVRASRGRYLLFQSLYVVSFHLAILGFVFIG